MGLSKKHIVILGVLYALSFLPVFPDPYTHKEPVCFWVWLWKEIYEVYHGEQS